VEKIFYFLRVLFVSAETFSVCAGFFAWHFFRPALQSAASSLNLDPDIQKWIMLFPIGLAVWVFKECRLLLQESDDVARFLVGWDDYWRVKVHVWVSLIYSVCFAGLSATPWVLRSGISSAGGLLLFCMSVLAQAICATSVYTARIKIGENRARLKSTLS
jgi:hypothetical protein